MKGKYLFLQHGGKFLRWSKYGEAARQAAGRILPYGIKYLRYTERWVPSKTTLIHAILR